jgi:uncharacterized protein
MPKSSISDKKIRELKEELDEILQELELGSNTAQAWNHVEFKLVERLHGIWKNALTVHLYNRRLYGDKPNEAYSVMVGLGSTMTPEDLFSGTLKVTVKVALFLPNEFIEINLFRSIDPL